MAKAFATGGQTFLSAFFLSAFSPPLFVADKNVCPPGDQPLELQHLFEDFAGGEIAHQAVEAGGAERAAHRAADLCAQADAAMLLVVAQEHALDPLGVQEFEEQFFGAVGRFAVLGNAGSPNLELGGELLAKARGQIGHFLEAGRPPLEEPLSHLSRAIGRQAVLREPVAQPDGSLLEKWDHKSQCTGNVQLSP